MTGAFPVRQNSNGGRTSDIRLDADHSRRIGDLSPNPNLLPSRRPNRGAMTQGSRITASSVLRRMGKPSTHGISGIEASTGQTQNTEADSHWPLSVSIAIIGRKPNVLHWKRERRIGQYTKAGAALLPWLETCRVSLAGSTSNAGGSWRQMFQNSAAQTTAQTGSRTARGTNCPCQIVYL